MCVAEAGITRLRERGASILAGEAEEERATCKGHFGAAVQATGDHTLVVSPPSAAVPVHTAFMPLSRSIPQQRPLLILWRSVIVHTTGLSSPSAAPASSSPSLPPHLSGSLSHDCGSLYALPHHRARGNAITVRESTHPHPHT